MAQTMLAPEHKDRNPTFLKFIYKTEVKDLDWVSITKRYYKRRSLKVDKNSNSGKTVRITKRVLNSWNEFEHHSFQG